MRSSRHKNILISLMLTVSLLCTGTVFAFADVAAEPGEVDGTTLTEADVVATESDAASESSPDDGVLVSTSTDEEADGQNQGEWVKQDGIWAYLDQDGNVLLEIANQKSTFIDIEGKTFYISKKHAPVGQGFHYIQKRLYYMGADRAVIKGATFTDVDGKEYRATKNGYVWGLKYYQYKYPKTTYVLVDISEQKLYFSKSGKLKYTFNVVTGLPGAKTQTPTGTYKVLTKFRNAHLRGKVNGKSWDRHVSYWIAFIGSEYGFHDATWRDDTDFDSDQTYLTNGSAGCVTMRLKDVRKLYNAVTWGTKVIICK